MVHGARLKMRPSGTGRGKKASGSDNADGPGVGVGSLCGWVRMVGREPSGWESSMGVGGGCICAIGGGHVGRMPQC